MLAGQQCSGAADVAKERKQRKVWKWEAPLCPERWGDLRQMCNNRRQSGKPWMPCEAKKRHRNVGEALPHTSHLGAKMIPGLTRVGESGFLGLLLILLYSLPSAVESNFVEGLYACLICSRLASWRGILLQTA